MIEVNVEDLIAKHFQPFDLSKRDIWNVGGRSTTKTSCDNIVAALQMLNDRNLEIVIIREHLNQHRDSTMVSMSTAFQRLRLQEDKHYKITYSPLRITMLGSNQQIHFGSRKEWVKAKGIEPSSKDKYIGLVIFNEFGDYPTKEGIDELIATYGRGGNKKQFNIIYEGNRPADEFHWYYEEEQKVLANPDIYTYIFSTYQDLTDWEMLNWNGQEMINIIENTKQLDYEQYKHTYLSQPRKLKGLIYTKFSDELIRDMPIEQFSAFSVGIDYGEKDAVSAILTGFIGATHMHPIDQYFHRNKRDEMDINDYAAAVDEWLIKRVKEIREQTKLTQHILDVYVDSANLSFIKLLKQKSKSHGMYKVSAVDKSVTKESKGKGAIQERIDFVNLMIGANRFSVSPKCKELIKEMSRAIYNDKQERVDNANYRVDSQDSHEYSFKKRMSGIRKWVLAKGAKEIGT